MTSPPSSLCIITACPCPPAQVNAIKIVYDTLGPGLNRSVQFSLFDRHFILNIPSSIDDPFPGASLTDLVEAFKQDVMLLW